MDRVQLTKAIALNEKNHRLIQKLRADLLQMPDSYHSLELLKKLEENNQELRKFEDWCAELWEALSKCKCS